MSFGVWQQCHSKRVPGSRVKVAPSYPGLAKALLRYSVMMGAYAKVLGTQQHQGTIAHTASSGVNG
jgi:hypothetical protein